MRLLLILPLVALTACIKPNPLPVMGTVPGFHLIDQAGQEFDGRSLDGHVWVADFVYTTCDGPCPMMSSQMHLVQTSTAETPDVKLVSFTVDPAHDTPAVLAEYAKHFRYDPARWSFLTGDQAGLNDLGLNGFKLNGVDGTLTHSTRFVLVDRQRRIRGYYISSDDGFLLKLVHDVRQLEQEKS
ncbi:MAG TPA: SCO family protein [Bryobacteraceae bacterium]|nr:SCO family protein [Bryobacteraceae bacterium]